jgi:hypothetical protein
VSRYHQAIGDLSSVICHLILAVGENEGLKELIPPLAASVDPGSHRWEAAMVFDP